MKKKCYKIVSYFIMFFPILDLITSYMTTKGMSISFGMIIKAIFMIFICFQLVFVCKDNKNNNYIFGTLLFFTLCHLANNYSYIRNTFDISYISFVFKYFYFIVMVLYFSSFFKESNYDITILKTPIKIVLISLCLATLTSTSQMSYFFSHKIGTKGWFFSANELGALLSLFYPISIYLFFHDENGKKYEVIYVIINAIYLILLGTKVGVLSYLLVTGIYILYRAIFIKKYLCRNGLIMPIMFIMTIVWFPKLPAVVNSSEKLDAVIELVQNEQETSKEGSKSRENHNKISKSKKSEKTLTEIQEAEIKNEMLYSGRHEFIFNINSQINLSKLSSPKKYIIDRLFGTVYLTNNMFLLTERDFHDTYFFFGIFGLIILLVTIFKVYILNLKRLFKRLFNLELDMLSLSFVLVLGIAFIAGHTLFSPMVSTYIAIVIGLVERTLYEKIKDKKKKVLIASVHLECGGIEKALVNLLNNMNLELYDVDLFLQLDKNRFYNNLPQSINILTPCYNHNFINSLINKKNIICKIIKHLLFNKYTAWLYVTNKNYDSVVDFAGYYDFITQFIKKSNSYNKIIWIHSMPSKILGKNEYKKYHSFNKIVLVSNSAKIEFDKLYPQFICKSMVINNYVNSREIINLSKKTIDDFPKNGYPSFLIVARLEEEAKRISRAIEASKKLIEEKYNFNLIIIGHGKDYENYKKMIENAGLNHKILLLGTKTNPYPYFKKSDAYLMCSEYEGFPTVFMESLVLSLPIITTNVSDACKLVNQGYGILCPSKDTIGVYKGMKEFLDQGFKINNKFNSKEFNLNITKLIDSIF